MAGENRPLVGALLGHRRHRTPAGYAHLADAHLVAAAMFDRSRAGTRPTGPGEAGERLHAGISAGLDAIRDRIVGARSVAASGDWHAFDGGARTGLLLL